MDGLDDARARLAPLVKNLVERIEKRDRVSVTRIIEMMNESPGAVGVCTRTRFYNAIRGDGLPPNGGHMMALCDIAKATKAERLAVACALHATHAAREHDNKYDRRNDAHRVTLRRVSPPLVFSCQRITHRIGDIFTRQRRAREEVLTVFVFAPLLDCVGSARFNLCDLIGREIEKSRLRVSKSHGYACTVCRFGHLYVERHAHALRAHPTDRRKENHGKYLYRPDGTVR